MRLLRIEELTGNERLARPIITEGYFELLAEGTLLKSEYISKLKEIGISEVFVDDGIINPQYVKLIRDEVSEKCVEKVKNILARHTIGHNKDYSGKIGEDIENIVESILSEEKIVEQIYDIRERSADLYEHSINTCALSMLIALKMNLPKARVREIGIGCLLHDIGLRYISLPFENKPLEKMSDSELEEFKKHTVYGYSALESEKWLSKESLDIILYHHERLDGSGYPLKATDFSNGVRIVMVCDFFDEAICGITQERRKVVDVVNYLRVNSRRRFDAEIVKILLDFTAAYPAGTVVLTSDGDKAVVIRQNRGFPEKPVLQLLSNKFDKKYGDNEIMDLLAYSNIKIIKVLS